MDILTMVLLAAGALFLIAMFFICFGLFHTPKAKKHSKPVDIEDEYLGYTPSGRRLAAYDSGDNTEASPEDTSESGGTADTADTSISDDDKDEETKDPTDENDPETASDDSDEGENENGNGINITVTIIETNKSKKLTVSDETLIGRNERCDVVIAKPMVSSVHCILTNDKGKLMAEDNNSTNGTLLNGKPLKHVVEIKNNDVLTFGDKQIRINF